MYAPVGIEESIMNAPRTPLVSLHIKSTNNANSEVLFKQVIRDL
jgi:hypothetical protein